MKLQELGLKQKPQTKYFEGGYVSFSTDEGELSFKVRRVTKLSTYTLYSGIITEKDQYDTLMKIKEPSDVMRLFA